MKELQHIDLELLNRCAEFSNKVYSDNSNDVISFDLDAQCMITTSDDDVVYIVFRGTSSIQDMLQDLKIDRLHPEFLPYCKVHKGALEQYLAIREYVLNLYLKKQKIIFTGHSLGAMLATIASLDYSYNFKGDASCITFGSPRVGDKRFCKHFKTNVKTSYRCVFNNDIISYTPICLRFRHINKLIICKQDKLLEKKTNISCWMSVNDHSMENYINAIQNYTRNINNTSNNDIVMYPIDNLK